MAHRITKGASPRPISACLALGLVLFSKQSMAETALSYTLGHGQGNYQSHALEGSIDVPGLPLEIGLDLMTAREAGTTVSDQSGLAVNWRVSPFLSTRLRWSAQNDTTLSIAGQELGASLHLQRLWESERETRVDLGFGRFNYSLRGGSSAQNKLVPDQRRTSLGLRQDLTAEIGAYVTYESNRYSRDPVVLAIKLLNSRRQRQNTALSLTGFPDHARTWGLTWSATQQLDLDLSSGRTESVIGQTQDTLRLAATWQLTKNSTTTVALANTRSAAITRPNGALLIGKSNNAAIDLTFGWTFD